MRRSIFQSHILATCQSTAVLVAMGLLASCSSDAARFDDLITASTQITPNQQKIIRSSSEQPYPGDVSSRKVYVANRAPTAINETNERIEYGKVVEPVKRQALNHVTTARHKVENTYSNAQNTYQKAQNTYSQVKQQPARVASVYQAHKPSVNNGQLVLQPRQQVQNPLRQNTSQMNDTDHLSTGSTVRAPLVQSHTSQARQERQREPVQLASAQPVGWQNPKGTWVTIHHGETLYNLSRRYGVPVKAILKANNIADGNNVVAGSRILIPTYHYTKEAPISAPDSNPVTRASRSSKGFQGQAVGRLTVPTRRMQPYDQTQPAVQPAPAPKVFTAQQNTAGNARHKVVAGDTLYGIARRYGVSTDSIMAANAMSSATVRLGQKLIIPSQNGRIIAQQNNVDEMTTGSIPNKPAKVSVPKPKTQNIVTARAETQSSVRNVNQASGFSWPVKGRLIGQFGQRNASGTNDGIDISVPVGTPVRATQQGKVIYSGAELEDFGKLILVSHANGWVSAYAHASNTLVRRGDIVRKGQVIAKSGRTGNAQTPRVHFELRKNSNPVNPLKYLAR